VTGRMTKERASACTATAVAVLAGLTLLAAACAPRRDSQAPPLQTVSRFDIDRYLGTWYEIASYPNRFQRGCVATTATYGKRADGAIEVVNSCREERFDGKLKRVEGKAWVAGDKRDPAKLKVQFFWPFSGNYWVIGLDPEYRWAIVGEPSRDYLWILSRTPSIPDELYQRLMEQVRAAGYDTTRLRRTPQPG
jgi:apolipoprotein D and lipocalin family protein